ncbi:putative bifunctional diguanylate cyclase/phosphodiesterase [Terrihabitans rhizophilus]|uniref:EAL domain-containing protein n=1 Tax=Terrihabitans rhizophilus TaxID=3092662 RepID=A0ABU4RL44_9HYPH|nr:EAL domain-containing protein [Terrihabitans sp. PJ23]MDX6805550.1 EAL domain-containing protein [Terrihabitans sp. PJ23]
MRTFSSWFAGRALPAIIGIIAVSFILTIFLIVRIADAQNTASLQRTAEFAEAAVSRQREALERTAKDYAAWADAYRHLHPQVDLQWSYEEGNIGSTLFPDLGIDHLLVIGPSDDTAYAVVEGKLSANAVAERLLDGGIRALVARARESGTETVPVTGFLSAGGHPVLAAAAVISPGDQDDVARAPGPTSVLVLASGLTPERLERLAGEYFVPALRSVPADGLRPEESIAISSEDGSLRLALEWDAERPGQALIDQVLPWVLAAAVLMGLLAFLILRYAVRTARTIEEGARELAAAHRKAEHLAMHDAVTGLPNRSMMSRFLDSSIGRESGQALALIYLDLDRFKPVNDTMGHLAGDLVLGEVANRLRSAVREKDLVARVGGDEFVVALRSVTAPAEVELLCQRLKEAVSQPIRLDGTDVGVGMSAGIAMAPTDAQTSEELIRMADIAMYQAKATRRGSHQFYSPEMNDLIRQRRALEIDLRRALASQEFVLHFQPRLRAETLQVMAVEALVRWQHPIHGLVAPGDFIPLAEETGLIIPLGDWVLQEACRAAACYPDLVVSVNVSPVQFRNGDLVEQVRAALSSSGLPASRLELELTEGVLLENIESAIKSLRALKALGVSLAMDDFGTGYSSLGYLQHFPFDRLKIDKSFIAPLGDREDSRSIVQAILSLGRALGMSVTAEGVESAEQLRVLRDDNCDELQGFLLGRPMPAEQLSELLADPARSMAEASAV